MFKDKKLIKNYIILVVIFILVVLLMMYISRWYRVYSEYEKQTPIIRGTLTYEITSNDFEPYIAENPTSVIYMCTSSSDSCRNFEVEFKKYIQKYNLQNTIIYLNLSDTNTTEFVNNFNEKYNYKLKLTENYPALVEFTDGKVTSLIEGSEDNTLTISKVDDFMKINYIAQDDEDEV